MIPKKTYSNPLSRFSARLFLLLSYVALVGVCCASTITEPIPEDIEEAVTKETQYSLELLEDLSVEQKTSYKKAISDYLSTAMQLRSRIFEAALQGDERIQREWVKHSNRATKQTTRHVSKILQGKNSRSAKAYLRYQNERTSLYGDVGNSWKRFLSLMKDADLDEKQLERLRPIMISFYVKFYAGVAANPNLAKGMSPEAKAARLDFYKSLPKPRQEVRTFLDEGQMDYFRNAVSKTSRISVRVVVVQ